MRYVLLFPVILLLFSFDSERASNEIAPDYVVKSSKQSSSVSINESLIQFHFRNDVFNTVTDSILISYNGVRTVLHPDSAGKANLIVTPGKYVFQFYCNSMYYEIYTDSIALPGGYATEIEITFRTARIFVTPAKPVIYVYPEHSMEVNITLKVSGQLGYTYPKYNAGWNFVADPDGTIHMNGKSYDYLFWDGTSSITPEEANLNSGSIVHRDSLTQFFETRLTAMGLSAREQQDFITYWVPLMQMNEHNYIHFMFNQEYNSIATLDINPAPDHLLRVFMVWSDAKNLEASRITPQTIPTFERSGFTVVEWGGSEATLTTEHLTNK